MLTRRCKGSARVLESIILACVGYTAGFSGMGVTVDTVLGHEHLSPAFGQSSMFTGHPSTFVRLSAERCALRLRKPSTELTPLHMETDSHRKPDFMHRIVYGRPGGIRQSLKHRILRDAPKRPITEHLPGLKDIENSSLGLLEREPSTRSPRPEVLESRAVTPGDDSTSRIRGREHMTTDSGEAAPTSSSPAADILPINISGKRASGSVLHRSRVVEAPVEACFAVAADLDRYQHWAHHGLKQLEVLDRVAESGRVCMVKMHVGKFGIHAVNTLQVAYPEPEGSKMVFTCLQGDAIPIIDATYTFKRVNDSSNRTLVSFQLDIGFGFTIPDVVKDKVASFRVEG
jgi:hypothetical protein